jgi:hypothetical protein
MNNGEINLVTLSQPNRVPLGALYLGNISNATDTVITGDIKVIGDLTNTSISGPSSIGPVTFSLGIYSQITGVCGYQLSVLPSITPGAYQAQIQILRNALVVGRIIVSLILLDLATPNTDDMDPPATLGGVLQLLQVTENDFEHIS